MTCTRVCSRCVRRWRGASLSALVCAPQLSGTAAEVSASVAALNAVVSQAGVELVE